METATQNMITMIGCDRNTFEAITNGYDKSKLSLSGGSYYADWWLFADCNLIARFDHNGNLKRHEDCNDEPLNQSICGNCENHYQYGVMGFDGMSYKCKLHDGEKDPFDTCADFSRRVGNA